MMLWIKSLELHSIQGIKRWQLPWRKSSAPPRIGVSTDLFFRPLFREETREKDLRELLDRARLKPDTMCLTLTVEEFGQLAQIYGDISSRARPVHEQLDRKINEKELTFELGETYVRPKKLKHQKKSKKDWDE